MTKACTNDIVRLSFRGGVSCCIIVHGKRRAELSAGLLTSSLGEGSCVPCFPLPNRNHVCCIGEKIKEARRPQHTAHKSLGTLCVCVYLCLCVFICVCVFVFVCLCVVCWGSFLDIFPTHRFHPKKVRVYSPRPIVCTV